LTTYAAVIEAFWTKVSDLRRTAHAQKLDPHEEVDTQCPSVVKTSTWILLVAELVRRTTLSDGEGRRLHWLADFMPSVFSVENDLNDDSLLHDLGMILLRALDPLLKVRALVAGKGADSRSPTHALLVGLKHHFDEFQVFVNDIMASARRLGFWRFTPNTYPLLAMVVLAWHATDPTASELFDGSEPNLERLGALLNPRFYDHEGTPVPVNDITKSSAVADTGDVMPDLGTYEHWKWYLPGNLLQQWVHQPLTLNVEALLQALGAPARGEGAA
jgi:hypothetical protein